MDVAPEVKPEAPSIQTPDQIVAKYNTVEPVVENTTKTLSDIAKEQDIALAKSRQDQIQLEDANNEPTFLATNPTAEQ